MKIFLTGGTGFIGSHFINEVHKQGFEVVALRRPGSLPRLSLLKEPVWVDGELDDDLKGSMSQVDVVVHLASHTPNPPYDSLSRCLYWNVYASLRLAEQARLCGVKKYLVIGSCFEYGLSANYYEKIPADAPLLPVLSYPCSKAAASLAFSSFACEQKTQVKILRLFQVYGEGEAESRFWPSLKVAAEKGKDFSMSMGGQVRDFIHVHDVVVELVRELSFCDLGLSKVKIKNIGSGKPQTLLNFAEYWWKNWGASGCLNPGAVAYRDAEIMTLAPDLKPKYFY